MLPTSRSALLDANMLLLAISADVGFSRLRNFGRLQVFVEEDVQPLNDLLSRYARVMTTAYVLAEISNLANKLSGRLRDEWYTALARYTITIPEQHVATADVGRLPELTRFGVTDAALCELAKTHTIITAEYRLSGYLRSLGLDVINFNHLRTGT